MGTEESHSNSSKPIDLTQWTRERAQNGKNNYTNINDRTLIVEQNFICIDDKEYLD